jgi:hypothetical protein
MVDGDIWTSENIAYVVRVDGDIWTSETFWRSQMFPSSG